MLQLQLPQGFNNLDFDIIIHKSNNIVNKEFEKGKSNKMETTKQYDEKRTQLHNQIKIVLNQAFIFAVQEEYLQYNPINRLRTPKNAPVTKVDALTKTEQQKVEELCLSQKYKNNIKFKATLFLLHTGLRVSELFNLCWDNVFLYDANPYIYIKKSKTVYGKRIVPLDETALKIICSLPHISQYVFSYGGGRPLSQTMMKKHNQQIREITHISNMTNHICRHSFATRLVEKNINIKVLSKVMGHATVAFTMERYCSVSKDYIFNEMNKVMMA